MYTKNCLGSMGAKILLLCCIYGLGRTSGIPSGLWMCCWSGSMWLVGGGGAWCCQCWKSGPVLGQFWGLGGYIISAGTRFLAFLKIAALSSWVRGYHPMPLYGESSWYYCYFLQTLILKGHVLRERRAHTFPQPRAGGLVLWNS